MFMGLGLAARCQALGDITAHLGGEQPQQRPGPALHADPLDHPDTSSGDWLHQMVEDNLAQRHWALAHKPPPSLHRRDGKRAAQAAALLRPAADTRLERAIQPRELLAYIPLWPAGHVDPHRPDRSWLG